MSDEMTNEEIRRMVSEIESNGLDTGDLTLTISPDAADGLLEEAGLGTRQPGHEWNNTRSKEFWDKRVLVW